MDKQTAYRLIAYMLVVLILMVISASMMGCRTTTIRMSHIVVDPGGISTTDTMEVESIPRDWVDVDFVWYDMRLRAGAAVTAVDPWAEIVGEVGTQVIREAVCLKNPLLRGCLKGPSE